MSMESAASLAKRNLMKEIDDKRYALSTGTYDDIIQYKSECAFIRGLETGLAAIDHAIQKLRTDDNEDNNTK